MTQAVKEKVPDWAWKIFVTAFFALAGYWANDISHKFDSMQGQIEKVSTNQQANGERLARLEENQRSDHETQQAIRVFLQGHSWDVK